MYGKQCYLVPVTTLQYPRRRNSIKVFYFYTDFFLFRKRIFHHSVTPQLCTDSSFFFDRCSYTCNELRGMCLLKLQMLKHGNSIYFTRDILVCFQNPVTNSESSYSLYPLAIRAVYLRSCTAVAKVDSTL